MNRRYRDRSEKKLENWKEIDGRFEKIRRNLNMNERFREQGIFRLYLEQILWKKGNFIKVFWSYFTKNHNSLKIIESI